MCGVGLAVEMQPSERGAALADFMKGVAPDGAGIAVRRHDNVTVTVDTRAQDYYTVSVQGSGMAIFKLDGSVHRGMTPTDRRSRAEIDRAISQLPSAP